MCLTGRKSINLINPLQFMSRHKLSPMMIQTTTITEKYSLYNTIEYSRFILATCTSIIVCIKLSFFTYCEDRFPFKLILFMRT